MKLQIDRIDQHALTGFINRVKLIDSFVYMKIKDGQITSAVYLPQRDAVKSHAVECDKIFQISEWPDTDLEMKVAFFEGAKVIEAIKHFDADAINDELEIKLSCSEPSLGFKDLTPEQQAVIFAIDDTKFSFNMDTHTIGKVKNLFGLDKEETFSVKANGTGVSVSGKSFNATINPESNGAGEVTVYKKYLNLLDREEQKVHISDGKIVFQSTESQTLLTVSTCQTA
mgnify:CR=1 FL=1